jgi:SMI1-KNR4 cell-wall
MAFDRDKFWKPGPTDPFWKTKRVRLPLTEENLVLAEQQLRVKLPPEYIALLRIQNGGDTIGFGFPMTEQRGWAIDHVPFDEMARIGHDPKFPWTFNILDSADFSEEWQLPPRQILLSGDGHWWMTLDYRKGDIPSVAWIDLELDQDLQVAPTFGEFLEGLRPTSEFGRI